jgi:4'-phosphopantetheinyl transferase EntD
MPQRSKGDERVNAAGRPDPGRMRENLLRPLLPARVVVVEAPVEQMQAPPHPDEEVLIATAHPGRRREFLAGRTAARRALAALGAPPGPILAREDRAPVWPAGWVGSITHTRTHAAAAAAHARDFAALGIDFETVDRFDLPLARHILTLDEQVAMQALPLEARQARLAAVFCAKEAFYKAQHPLTGRWLGFQHVETPLAGDGGGFTVRMVGAAANIPRCEGRFQIAGGWAAAALAIAAEDSAALAQAVMGD